MGDDGAGMLLEMVPAAASRTRKSASLMRPITHIWCPDIETPDGDGHSKTYRRRAFVTAAGAGSSRRERIRRALSRRAQAARRSGKALHGGANPRVGGRGQRPRGDRERLVGWLVDAGFGLSHADVEPFSPTGSPPPKMTERHARKY
jgi:hypothetical protein